MCVQTGAGSVRGKTVGTWYYAELLEIIQDPNHEETLDRLEWSGEVVGPEDFDLKQVNQ